jgi:hypothetical protein
MNTAATGSAHGNGSRAGLQGSLWQRFRLLPRAAQWAIIGGGAIVLLYLYSDYVLATANAWNEEANQRQHALAKARMINDSARVSGSLGDAIKVIGEVEVPDDEAATSAALGQAISDVLKKYQVSNDRFNPATPGKLPRGTMAAILKDREARYISGNLEFESSVESAASIIADLESSPAIESISALRITRSGAGAGQRRVNVRLTIESWVMASAGRAAGRGALR